MELGILGTAAVDVIAKFDKMKSNFDKAAAETEASAQGMGERMGSRLSAAFSPKNLMIGGALITAIGAPLQEMSNKLEVSANQLEQGAKNVGMSMEELGQKTKGLKGHMEDMGHTETETNKAMLAFVQAGRPAAEITHDVGIASQYASTHGGDLAEAATKIAKGYGGATKFLKEYGITVGDVPMKPALKELKDHIEELKKQEHELGLSAAEQKAGSAATAGATAATTHQVTTMVGHGKTAHEVTKTVKDHTVAHHDNTKAINANKTELAAQIKVLEDQFKAQGGAKKGVKDFGAALDELDKRTKGQDAAAMDTFGGKLDVLKTKFMDVAAHVGKFAGPVMSALGPVMLSAGGIMQLWTGHTAKHALATVADTEAVAAEEVAAGTSVAPTVAAGVAADTAAGGFFAMAAGVMATLAPFVLIIAGLALVGVAAYELYQHWDEVWSFIKDTASAAWNDVIKPVFGFIKHAIETLPLVWLLEHWKQVWDGIKDAVSGAWNWIKGIFDDFMRGIDLLAKKIESIPVLGTILKGGSGILGGATSLLGFAEGGTVPGPIGMPRLAVVHGGEVVTPPGQLAGVVGLTPSGGGGTTIIVQGSLVTERELARVVDGHIGEMRGRGQL